MSGGARKWLAWLLVAVMFWSMMPFSVLAEGADDQGTGSAGPTQAPEREADGAGADSASMQAGSPTQAPEASMPAEAPDGPEPSPTEPAQVMTMAAATAVTARKIAFDPTSLVVDKGEKRQLQPVFTPEDTSNRVLAWTTSNAKVATVDENGLLTAVGVGKATITATTGDGSKKTAKLNVRVVILAKGISISGAKELAAGEKTTLKAEVAPTDASDKGVTWTSSDEKVATVGSGGEVRAKKAVSATTQVVIRATTKDGTNLVAEHMMTVKPKASGVTILVNDAPASSASLDLAMAKALALSATVAPGDASQAVTWSTSDKRIATVGADGTVTAVKAGTVTITATATDGSKKKATCKLTLSVLAKGISISGAKELAAGEKTTLKAAVTPAETGNKGVVWTSSDEKVAKVDSRGEVTAAKALSAITQVTIRATTKDGTNLAAEHVMTVKPKASGVTILVNGAPASSASLDLAMAKTLALSATVAPGDASQAVTWSTSDKRIATVGADGTVTAVKAGTATITATATDGSKKKATCKLTLAVLAKGISISGAKELAAGGKTTLKAAVTPADTGNKGVVWTSSDEKVAKVDSRGEVTAAKALSATTQVTIRATTKDGTNLAAEHVMTVKPKASGVTILVNGAPARSASLDLATAKTLALSATVAPGDASQAVTWSTSDKRIATVGADGTVTAVKAGTATITATATDGSKKKATCKLTLSVLAKGISISGAKELAAGEKTTLKAAVTPAETGNKGVVWSSSNTAAAKVNEGGVVTAKKVSATTQVTIRATTKDGTNLVAEHVIAIKPKASRVAVMKDGYEMDYATIFLGDKDKTIQLTAKVEPADASQAVTWTSSDTKLATVSAEGLVTGRKPGTVTITATARDGSGRRNSIKIRMDEQPRELSYYPAKKEMLKVNEREVFRGSSGVYSVFSNDFYEFLDALDPATEVYLYITSFHGGVTTDLTYSDGSKDGVGEPHIRYTGTRCVRTTCELYIWYGDRLFHEGLILHVYEPPNFTLSMEPSEVTWGDMGVFIPYPKITPEEGSEGSHLIDAEASYELILPSQLEALRKDGAISQWREKDGIYLIGHMPFGQPVTNGTFACAYRVALGDKTQTVNFTIRVAEGGARSYDLMESGKGDFTLNPKGGSTGALDYLNAAYALWGRFMDHVTLKKVSGSAVELYLATDKDGWPYLGYRNVNAAGTVVYDITYAYGGMSLTKRVTVEVLPSS